jgi:hypothetical protein
MIRSDAGSTANSLETEMMDFKQEYFKIKEK